MCVKLAALVLVTMSCAAAQDVQGTLVVRVKDGSGAVVPGAIVQVAGRSGAADAAGEVAFANLPPGSYGVHVSWQGFSEYDMPAVQVRGNSPTVLDASLELKPSADSVTVSSDPTGELSTEPSSNASAIVLQGEDLNALPDDPDDLAADLRAIAGPAAESGAAEILVDGFSGGRLPAKASIREIRINQNPFSAEYDRLGMGRVEVLTKPGSEQYHGAAFLKFSDAAFNSRNPYSPVKAPYQSRQFGGDFGGPIARGASVSLEFERHQMDDNAVVNATALNSQLRIVPVQQTVVSPGRFSYLSARLDEQLGTRNTLSGRVTWQATDTQNAGVGALVLPSRAYRVSENNYSAQLTGTSVLSARSTNEARFQFSRESTGWNGTSSGPSILVLDSFAGGSPLDPMKSARRDRFEFQNITSWAMGRHTIKFGGRVRDLSLADSSQKDFNGLFVFAGGPQLSSIERYRQTLLWPPMGVGPSQFILAAGVPQTDIRLADASLFAQDDWRLTSALSISAGVRWESQTGVGDRADFAPRVGFAWAPGTGKQRKTVVRGGFGVFFQRVGEDVLLNAARYGGTQQALYIVHDPTFFPVVPSAAQLAAMGMPQTIHQLQAGLQAPYLLQSSLSVERQLPFRVVVSTTYTHTRALHLLMLRKTGDVFTYESTGILNQNQWLANVSRRFSGHFSMFGYYSYGQSFSDTDGPTFVPSDSNNVRADYGRSPLDIRHRVVMGGSIHAPLGLRFSPFLLARSGAPYNITSGAGANASSVFNDRPAFGPSGSLNLYPAPGERIIPHNFGQGPAFSSLNVRVSRTFGFGSGEGRHPSLLVAVQVRNAMNHLNGGIPIGTLSSPLFGRSNWLASSAGPDSQAMGDNRRIQLQLRLTF